MKITPVIAQLRRYCPVFGERVAGALEFAALRDNQRLPAISAFVVKTDDNAGENQTLNTSRQDITDEFDVCVLINTEDARGQSRADLLDDVRAQLWLALVGWTTGGGYSPIEYRGSELVQMDRELIFYRYTFSSVFTLGGGSEPETWHEYYLAGLPPLKTIHVDIDMIDPSDPNLQRPGPDGRIDFSFREEFRDDGNDEGQTG
ncbi:phage tail terminator protein [Paraburkholderia susongensis]|uniref:Uncharacterized protein n=1 Tax=Paraburkholderia susongensis TaxID=1515439 RepID=A0A1X7I4X8_9BURK|nr:hypothetical protein [Paraburkholderia susongensis]SMG09509.1 hypothetical protein SAMN06265784_101325 [Paraburkholderia susongensis]